MKVMPADHGSVATWSCWNEVTALAAVWTEKKKGRGEDAPPTGLYQRSSGRGVIAVYDGAGGAGAREVGRTPDEEVTSAFVASRAARFALEDWFVTTAPKRRLPDGDDLHDALLDGLNQVGIAPRGKIRGNMVRHLPTTVAAIEYEILDNRRVELASRWAGDSRSYVVHPTMGLQAVSLDDTQDSDALVLLLNDQPMSNVVCADRPFHVNEFLGVEPLMLPVVIACATDGFYNYLPTPTHFEYLLLQTMQDAQGMQEWAQALAGRVQQYTSDDASLVIAALGYRNYQAMKHDYQTRYKHLGRHYVHPFGRAQESGSDSDVVAIRTDQWARYREGYEIWIRQMEADR
jgi:serine/threonine protein phosphatase PrpC